MGQAVFYCSQCGVLIEEAELTKGKAATLSRGKHLCSSCRSAFPSREVGVKSPRVEESGSRSVQELKSSGVEKSAVRGQGVEKLRSREVQESGSPGIAKSRSPGVQKSMSPAVGGVTSTPPLSRKEGGLSGKGRAIPGASSSPVTPAVRPVSQKPLESFSSPSPYPVRSMPSRSTHPMGASHFPSQKSSTPKKSSTTFWLYFLLGGGGLLFCFLMVIYLVSERKPTGPSPADQQKSAYEDVTAYYTRHPDDPEGLLSKIQEFEASFPSSSYSSEVKTLEDQARALQERHKQQEALRQSLSALQQSMALNPAQALAQLPALKDQARQRQMGGDFFNQIQTLSDQALTLLIQQEVQNKTTLFQQGTLSYHDLKNAFETFKTKADSIQDPSQKTTLKGQLDNQLLSLKAQWEQDAKTYWEALQQNIADLLAQNQFSDALAKILQFPVRFQGTQAYQAAQDLVKVVQKQKEESKAKDEETQRLRKEAQQEEEEQRKRDQELKSQEEKKSETQEVQESPTTQPRGKIERVKLHTDPTAWQTFWKKINRYDPDWSLYPYTFPAPGGVMLAGALSAAQPGNLFSGYYYSKREFSDFQFTFEFQVLQGTFVVLADFAGDVKACLFHGGCTLAIPPHIPPKEVWLKATLTVSGTDKAGIFSIERYGQGQVQFGKKSKGYLALVILPGSQVNFRNLNAIVGLSATAQAFGQSHLVFNGKNLTGWDTWGEKVSWTVEKGAVHGTYPKPASPDAMGSQPALLLYSKGNTMPTGYELFFKFKILKGGFGFYPRFAEADSWPGSELTPDQVQDYTSGHCTEHDTEGWYEVKMVLESNGAKVKWPCQMVQAIQGKPVQKGTFAFRLDPGQEIQVKDIQVHFLPGSSLPFPKPNKEGKK